MAIKPRKMSAHVILDGLVDCRIEDGVYGDCDSVVEADSVYVVDVKWMSPDGSTLIEEAER